jgi:hypothetical protein
MNLVDKVWGRILTKNFRSILHVITELGPWGITQVRALWAQSKCLRFEKKSQVF